MIDTIAVPYCINCDYINDTGKRCNNCGSKEIIIEIEEFEE